MTTQLKLLLRRIPTLTIPSVAGLFLPKSLSFIGSYQSLSRTRLMNFQSSQYHIVSRFRYQLNSKLHDSLQHLCHSPGRNLLLGNVLGLSIVTGLLGSSPQYALSEADQLAKDWDQSLRSGTRDEVRSKYLLWARKLWVPLLLVMTVMMGWNYPVTLTVNILLILLSTKPTPSSVYLWVEEWRQKNLLESHRFDWWKVGKPLHVEVADYKILCLAQVTSLNQKLIMIGILGEWWILYSSSSTLNFGPLSVVSPFA